MTLKHDNKARGFDMPERIETLFGLQLREWPLFSENYDHCAETLKEEVERSANTSPAPTTGRRNRIVSAGATTKSLSTPIPLPTTI